MPTLEARSEHELIYVAEAMYSWARRTPAACAASEMRRRPGEKGRERQWSVRRRAAPGSLRDQTLAFRSLPSCS